MIRFLCLVLAMIILLPSLAVADDDLPKRLFAEPSGTVRTGADEKAAKDRQSADFVLGFRPSVTMTLPTKTDAAYLARVKEKWPDCQMTNICGNIGYVDCNSAADGSAYYVDARTLETISTCGGACMSPIAPCENCPPKGWTCDPVGDTTTEEEQTKEEVKKP